MLKAEAKVCHIRTGIDQGNNQERKLVMMTKTVYRRNFHNSHMIKV